MLLDISDIELLNILNINCNTIGTEKEGKGANCNMRKIASLVQDVSCAVQTQTQKGVMIRQTAKQAATQTVAVFQISTIDCMMLSDKCLTIMRLNVLFQAQAQ